MSRARHKRDGGGRVPSNSPKPDKAGGNPNVFEAAAEKKSGGKVLGGIAGAKAKHRLDRPGRKMGGRVGADRSPLSSAHKGSETGPARRMAPRSTAT